MAECVGVAVIRAADRYIFGGAINAEGAETFYSEPAGGNGRALEICVGIQAGDVSVGIGAGCDGIKSGDVVSGHAF